MALYPYQQKAIDDIRALYRSGVRKVLLHLPTGGGKTHIFCEIIKQTEAKGSPCVMAVKGRQLVDQASQRLFRERVNHGVRMATHWNRNYGALVQVCSIDTLNSRRDYPPAKILVIDEAHTFTSPPCRRFMEQYPDAFVLAVTATPYTKEPLGHLAEAVVHPATVQQLIDQEFLLPPRYFAPSAPDMKGVKVVRGEFNEGQTEERMNTLTGDIVGHWQRLGDNRPTLGFAVSIAHSLSLVAQFKSQGIPAEHIEGNHTFKERMAAIERLRRGEVKVIFNVGVFCTGVDIPFLGCLIGARPTKSYNLYIQMAGRGTRLSPETGKKDFIYLDHAGNVMRHGFITEEREVHLGGSEIDEPGLTPKTCKLCYGVYLGTVCPECGPQQKVIEDKPRTVVIADGFLEELKAMPLSAEVRHFIEKCREKQKRKGYNFGWLYHEVKDKYGEEVARAAFPSRKKQTQYFRPRRDPAG